MIDSSITQRTRENWTYGIINIPLLYGHNNKNGVNPKTIIRKVAHNARCYRKPQPAIDKSKRYMWFELDEQKDHDSVLHFFKELRHDVYWHRSMKGYHYITAWLMDFQAYEQTVNYMKTIFHNSSFYYALRIVPNKWQNENGVWYIGNIEDNGSNDFPLLRKIQHAINQPYIFNYNRTIPRTVELLENIFYVSRYEFKGALKV